jgi:hypothetical protein
MGIMNKKYEQAFDEVTSRKKVDKTEKVTYEI